MNPSMSEVDPDLKLIIESWSRQPQALRSGIVAMVKASEV
jgi:hypothetical protein